MNQWPHGQANGMFSQAAQGHMNPAAMYNNLPGATTPTQFDLNQFTHGLQNGNGNASAPVFPNQPFQPGSIIPAKRTHDGMSGSPVQNQGSRSQTPNYAGFQNQQAAQQMPNAPTPYAHLQQSNSNNASPSPTMQNQPFRPPTQPQQRMQNASPSPFPGQQQQQQSQQQQPQGNFGAQMSPPPSQNPNQMPNNMAQLGQIGAFNQQFGATANPAMAGMQGAMAGQMNNTMSQLSAQKAYQAKLMQHQAQLQMRNNGMVPPRPATGQQAQMFNAQQQMPNGQAAGQMNLTAQQQQAMKRTQFLKTLASHAQSQGRSFNPNPMINGKPVDLFTLWSLVTHFGGSPQVERTGQWPQVAARMGFQDPNLYPTAAGDLRQLHSTNIGQYERLWFQMRASSKQEEARQHAHQMAGLGGPPQASPTRQMQPPNQQNPYSQQFQQGQQGQAHPQSTPVQANAQLPANGMVTPQQQMMQHRGSMSMQKPQQMTPQAGVQAFAVPSPHSAGKIAQRSPSVKQETAPAVLKSEEMQSTRYMPAHRVIQWEGGYDIDHLSKFGNEIAASMPLQPTLNEMGVIDVKAISLSLASGIHAEVRYALDALIGLSGIPFDLRQNEDLADVIIDCAEDQVELLSEDAAEVSDALDLPSYEDVIRGARTEAETLQDVPQFGTHASQLDGAADRLIAISTILRNLSFYDVNHGHLTSLPVIKWLSNTIRLLATRNLLLRSFFNTQDFYKDMILFLSNVTQSLELPSRDDALHILHFLLAFAPQPAPSYIATNGKIRFTSYHAYSHRYLPPAVDSLAKLLARQDPNRMLYKSIFSASSLAVSESPLDLLTRAFALSISVLPDRARGGHGHSDKMRISEQRKPFMSQGMLAADILTALIPGNDADLSRAWLESEDGWAVGLMDLVALLSVDRTPHNPAAPPTAAKDSKLSWDSDTYGLIAQRALMTMKRLIENASKSRSSSSSRHPGGPVGGHVNGVVNGHRGAAAAADDDADELVGLKWEGVPLSHTIIGALGLRATNTQALGLLCGLHDMVMQAE